MATMEEIVAQIQTLRQELQESRRREEDLNTRLQAVQASGAVQATLEEMVNTQKAILEASKKPDRKLTLVDNRGLAKPNNYDGSADFLQWKIRLEAFVESVHDDFGKAMAWAEDETDPISTSSMSAEFGDVNPAQETIPDLEAKDAQLYAVLQTLCEKEAFTLVRSSGKGKGLEAWRRLCKRYDPSTGGRRRALLRSVLSPNRCGKVEELSAAVEIWEDQVRQYENRRKTDGTRPTLDEDIKISILESICPVEVERHLQLNQARFADYQEVRKELSTYLETRIGLKLKAGSYVDTGGVQPMDIGAFGNDKAKKVCHNCGKPGHFKSDCWAPGGGKASSQGKSGKQGKGQKGGQQSNSGGKKGSPKGSKGGSKGGGKTTKGKDKGKGKNNKGKGKAMGNVEAEKEPEAEEQAGSWDASGWEGHDESGWNNWTEGGQGSSLEGNYLSLGALHRPAMVTKRHSDSESRSGLADSLVAALRNLPRGTDAGLRDSGTGSSGDRSVDMMMRLIDENYRLRDQLRAQGDQEQRSSERDRSRRRRSSPRREPEPEERSRDRSRRKRHDSRPKRDRDDNRHGRRRARSESSGRNRELVDRTATPKNAARRKSETPAASDRTVSRTPRGSVGDYLKSKAEARKAGEARSPTASVGDLPPGMRTPRSPPGPPPHKRKKLEIKPEKKNEVEPEERTDAKNTKPKSEGAPAIKAKPKPKTNSGLTSGSLSVLRGTLATQLMLDAEKTNDPELKRELERQKNELQQRAPRRSVAITADNLNDQSFHDSRYYADVASGKAHHIAWKNEKGRRRAILDRKDGVIDRARERMRLDAEWHEEHAQLNSGSKKQDVEGLKADVETEIIDERERDKDKPLEPQKEAVALSRREKESFRQFPKDEQETLEKPTKKKEQGPRIRGPDYYRRKNAARRERQKAEKAEQRAKEKEGRDRDRRHGWDPEEDEDDGGGDTESNSNYLSSLLAPLGGSPGEPHVVEERDGWRKIEVNLDTGAAATAIPTDLNLDGHARTPPQDVNYKTASAECLADEGGVVLKGTDVYGSAKVLEGRVTGVHRTLASGAKVARHHYMALGAHGGQLIPRNSQAGKEYAAFMEKLHKKHNCMTPVKVRNGIYLMDFWIAPGTSEGSFHGPPERV